MKVFVIGLDGCNWEILDKLIKKGDLPNIARIKKEGARGSLESCLPPVTAPNWKCYSTGKNPGKLGVFWWESIDCAKKKVSVPTSYSFKSGEMWDRMSREGKRVAVINMPTTYPPKRINGFMISGGPDSLESGFTYPKELEGRLKKEFGYRALPKRVSLLESGNREVIEEVRAAIRTRFEVAKALLAEADYDFAHLTIYLINVLQHFFWDDDCVRKAWRDIDRGIGELMEQFKEADFLFMSDHGSNRIKVKFNINTWLEKEGYLALRSKPSKGLLLRLGLNKERVVRLLTRLGLKDFAKRVVGGRASLPTSAGVVQSAGKEGAVDWGKTKVVASGQGPVYLNIPRKSPEYRRVRDEIIGKLENLEHRGIKIAKKVHTRDEIYSGPYLKKAPDLIIDQGENVHITGSLGFEKVFSKPSKWRGENSKFGVFMARGPRIKKGKVKKPHILDLAPTALKLMGMEPGRGLDGRALNIISSSS